MLVLEGSIKSLLGLAILVQSKQWGNSEELVRNHLKSLGQNNLSISLENGLIYGAK